METTGEQLLLEKWCQYICLMHGGHKPLICKNFNMCEEHKGKHNKMRYACIGT